MSTRDVLLFCVSVYVYVAHMYGCEHSFTFVCMCMHVCMCATEHMWRSAHNLQQSFFPSTMHHVGSGLAANSPYSPSHLTIHLVIH